MTKSIEIGSTLDLKNADGKAIVRLVYVGGNRAQMHRQYRNMLTGQVSDWQPSREAGETEPKTLTDVQITHWLAQAK